MGRKALLVVLGAAVVRPLGAQTQGRAAEGTALMVAGVTAIAVNQPGRVTTAVKLQSRGYQLAGGNDVSAVAWYDGNSGSTTHSVGGKQPNELGLYDMSGNVLEWCWDWFGAYGSSAQTDPKGPTSGSDRVPRGGRFWDAKDFGIDAVTRCAERRFGVPLSGGSHIGFRVARRAG